MIAYDVCYDDHMVTNDKRQRQLPQLKRQLAETLSVADDSSFLQMVWALNALQTGRANEAIRFIVNHPPEAAAEGILGKQAIYPWELETIANELLVTPKKPHTRAFNRVSWNDVGGLFNLLREVENADYGANRDGLSIFVEMGRLAARQFPWQRGYVGLPQLYRNFFVYGQGECASYLSDTNALSAADITLVGFALLSVFHPEPSIRPADDLHLIREFGISYDVLKRTISRIARPLTDIRREAQMLRHADTAIAYKPSMLRQFPCILSGPRNRTMQAPIPDLIMDRVTNGLFYDVIGGGGPVRDEIGRRFETYCFSLLSEMLPSSHFVGESSYPTRLGPIATPDILMLDEEESIQIAIECKATRMSTSARFGTSPEDDRGYDEIAKGIMQLWRFFAHCSDRTTTLPLSACAQGLILTMDEWFAGRSTIIPRIVARANEMADKSAHQIPIKFRRPIAFCTISELEMVLSTATAASLAEAIKIGSGERQGWIFSLLHDETTSCKTTQKEYPFLQDLRIILPWYSQIQDLRGDGFE